MPTGAIPLAKEIDRVGLESPVDGKNIIRGLIQRGYSDARAFFRRVMC